MKKAVTVFYLIHPAPIGHTGDMGQKAMVTFLYGRKEGRLVSHRNSEGFDITNIVQAWSTTEKSEKLCPKAN